MFDIHPVNPQIREDLFSSFTKSNLKKVGISDHVFIWTTAYLGRVCSELGSNNSTGTMNLNKYLDIKCSNVRSH